MLRGPALISECFSEFGAGDPGIHQGYHRLQEERSESACPNQGSSEDSVMSPCPWAAYSTLFLHQPYV